MVVHPNEEALSAWLDGEVASDEARELRVHLGGCAFCRARLEDLADVGAVLAPLRAVAPPATLRERLVEEWEGRWGRLKVRRPVGSFVLAWMPALATGMVLALIAPQFLQKSDSPSDITPSMPQTAPPDASGKETRIAGLSVGEWFKFNADALAPLAPRPSAPKHRSTSSPKGPFSLAALTSPVANSTEKYKTNRNITSDGERNERATVTNDSESSDVQTNSDLAAETGPSDDPTAQVAEKPVFELTVEEDPNASPMHPRKSLCSWTTETGENGEVDQGTIAHNYDEEGKLKSVVVSLALNDAPPEFHVPAKDSSASSTTSESTASETANSEAAPAPSEAAETAPQPMAGASEKADSDPSKTDTQDNSSSDTPQPSASSQKDEPNETLDSSDSSRDLFAGDTESHRLSQPFI
jgi:hypothetical protein